MKTNYTINKENNEKNIISDIVENRIVTEVKNALALDDNNFIVNPITYFVKNNNKMNPTVMNQAEYISKTFQSKLEKQGWIKEKTLLNQTIDAYKEFIFSDLTVNYVSPAEYMDIVQQTSINNPSYLNDIFDLHTMFYLRKHFLFPGRFSNSNFTEKNQDVNYRVGLEFETGNIASSFRAISKLNVLYKEKEIDLGIFVTSKDKEVSTKIWPSSNRNGSIEELKNRRVFDILDLPCILVGFSPEKWDENAGFFNKVGNRDKAIELEEEEFNGKKYKKCEFRNKRIVYKEIN